MKKVLLVVGVLLILTGCSKTTSINIVDKTLPIYKECISNIEEADKSLIGTHDVNLYLFYLSFLLIKQLILAFRLSYSHYYYYYNFQI